MRVDLTVCCYFKGDTGVVFGGYFRWNGRVEGGRGRRLSAQSRELEIEWETGRLLRWPNSVKPVCRVCHYRAVKNDSTRLFH